MTTTEVEQRLERARDYMHADGLAAILICTGVNLRYFSGYPAPDRSVVRPFFALLPLNGNPVFVSHLAHIGEAKRYSVIADVRGYQQLARVPAELLSELFREHDLTGKKVGMELGREQTIDISPVDFVLLQEAIRPAVLVDCSDLLWRLRSIKSPSEISSIRQACDIAGASYRRAFALVEDGASEHDIYSAMQRSMQQETQGSLFLVITSGSGNYDLVTKVPDNRILRTGDMVWMDAGCTVDGYWSDFSRCTVVGSPSAEQNEALAMVKMITSEAMRMVRPGVRVSDIATYSLKRIENLPFPITSSIAALAGRVGHGLGLSMTEPPHISVNEDTALEANMVITLEPGFATSYGTFHIEENLLVTEEGAVILSNCSRDFLV